ncbi:MAG: hypothetical protein ACI8U3_002181 [Brevundimonas sp.]|jgi:uncharacterized protein|uniref:DUF418 domain-containing protein n=1 Tax=Brevundimonas sp. TaxID=1871086 RepID=UPI0039E3FE07
MTGRAINPTAETERFQVLDLLRGFALCGILLANIVAMGQPWSRAYPAFPAQLTNPDWAAWTLQALFVEGSMRALFTLLFGAGVVLLTAWGARADRPGTADVHFRRAMLLMALGIGNAVVLLWPGDILYIYGVAALFLFVFRKLDGRVLIALSAMLIVIFSLADALGDWRAAAALNADPAAHAAAIAALTPSVEALNAEAAVRASGSYPAIALWSAGAFTDWALAKGAVLSVGRTVAFMMLGMGLFKLGVMTGARSMRFYLRLAVLGVAGGLAINVWETATLWRSGFDPAVWAPALTGEVGRLILALGYLGAIIAAWKANVLGLIGTGLERMGRMAMTNYLAQSLICAVLFYGFGLYDRLGWWPLWGLTAAIWIGQALFSAAWLSVFRMGPAEWAFRAVAYWTIPPLLRPRQGRSRPAAEPAPSR